ncbi:MAG TPA: hypothetical protein VM938_07260 [Acidimicrobiales bacterium]|nr:hypothetical protein [Acidimicrobiales bacterium]
MTVDLVAQVVIPTLAAVTVARLARQRPTGDVVGLASPPFWLATAVVHRQRGVVVSSTICAFAFAFAFADGRWRTCRNGRGEAADAGGD